MVLKVSVKASPQGFGGKLLNAREMRPIWTADDYSRAVNDVLYGVDGDLGAPEYVSNWSSLLRQLLVSRYDPPLQLWWTFTALEKAASLGGSAGDILQRGGATLDFVGRLLQSLRTLGAVNTSGNTAVSALAPVIALLCDVVEVVNKSVGLLHEKNRSFESDVLFGKKIRKLLRKSRELVREMLAFIVVCHRRECSAFKRPLSLPSVSTEAIAKLPDSLYPTFPLASKSMRKFPNRDKLDTAVVAEVVSVQVVILQLVVETIDWRSRLKKQKKVEGAEKEFVEKIKHLATHSIWSTSTFSISEMLLGMLLEKRLPLGGLVDNKEEMLMRGALYESVLVDPPFSSLVDTNGNSCLSETILDLRSAVFVRKLAVSRRAIEFFRSQEECSRSDLLLKRILAWHVPPQLWKLLKEGKKNQQLPITAFQNPQALLHWLVIVADNTVFQGIFDKCVATFAPLSSITVCDQSDPTPEAEAEVECNPMVRESEPEDLFFVDTFGDTGVGTHVEVDTDLAFAEAAKGMSVSRKISKKKRKATGVEIKYDRATQEYASEDLIKTGMRKSRGRNGKKAKLPDANSQDSSESEIDDLSDDEGFSQFQKIGLQDGDSLVSDVEEEFTKSWTKKENEVEKVDADLRMSSMEKEKRELAGGECVHHGVWMAEDVDVSAEVKLSESVNMEGKDGKHIDGGDVMMSPESDKGRQMEVGGEGSQGIGVRTQEAEFMKLPENSKGKQVEITSEGVQEIEVSMADGDTVVEAYITKSPERKKGWEVKKGNEGPQRIDFSMADRGHSIEETVNTKSVKKTKLKVAMKAHEEEVKKCPESSNGKQMDSQGKRLQESHDHMAEKGDAMAEVDITKSANSKMDDSKKIDGVDAIKSPERKKGKEVKIANEGTQSIEFSMAEVGDFIVRTDNSKSAKKKKVKGVMKTFEAKFVKLPESSNGEQVETVGNGRLEMDAVEEGNTTVEADITDSAKPKRNDAKEIDAIDAVKSPERKKGRDVQTSNEGPQSTDVFADIGDFIVKADGTKSAKKKKVKDAIKAREEESMRLPGSNNSKQVEIAGGGFLGICMTEGDEMMEADVTKSVKPESTDGKKGDGIDLLKSPQRKKGRQVKIAANECPQSIGLSVTEIGDLVERTGKTRSAKKRRVKDDTNIHEEEFMKVPESSNDEQVEILGDGMRETGICVAVEGETIVGAYITKSAGPNDKDGKKINSVDVKSPGRKRGKEVKIVDEELQSTDCPVAEVGDFSGKTGSSKSAKKKKGKDAMKTKEFMKLPEISDSKQVEIAGDGHLEMDICMAEEGDVMVEAHHSVTKSAKAGMKDGKKIDVIDALKSPGRKKVKDVTIANEGPQSTNWSMGEVVGDGIEKADNTKSAKKKRAKSGFKTQEADFIELLESSNGEQLEIAGNGLLESHAGIVEEGDTMVEAELTKSAKAGRKVGEKIDATDAVMSPEKKKGRHEKTANEGPQTTDFSMAEVGNFTEKTVKSPSSARSGKKKRVKDDTATEAEDLIKIPKEGKGIMVAVEDARDIANSMTENHVSVVAAEPPKSDRKRKGKSSKKTDQADRMDSPKSNNGTECKVPDNELQNSQSRTAKEDGSVMEADFQTPAGKKGPRNIANSEALRSQRTVRAKEGKGPDEGFQNPPSRGGKEEESDTQVPTFKNEVKTEKENLPDLSDSDCKILSEVPQSSVSSRRSRRGAKSVIEDPPASIVTPRRSTRVTRATADKEDGGVVSSEDLPSVPNTPRTRSKRAINQLVAADPDAPAPTNSENLPSSVTLPRRSRRKVQYH